MLRSGSSTILQTPSPLDRRSSPLSSSILSKNQLAHSLAPSAATAALGATTTVQPLSFNPSSAPIRQTQSSILPSSSSSTATGSKNVRFSPAHSSASYGYANQYSSAPPSRVQSTFASTPQRSGAYSSPSSSLLRTAQHNSYATPPKPAQPSMPASGGQQVAPGGGARTSPTVQAKQLFHAGEQKALHALAKPTAAVHEVKEKLKVAPLGRGEAARRLRVNAVLLVAWWVASRTTAYRFAAGHLVAAAPQLDTPLHLFETVLLLLLCYNIIDSLRSLHTLSSLPTGATVSPTLTSSPRPGPTRSSSVASFSSPVRSSPKTRPSPSSFGSPGSPSSSSTTARLRTSSSPFRASALSSPNPPTPQTPTSALRSGGADAAAASSAIRRSGSSLYGTPVRGGAAESPAAEGVSGALLAFEARHSPEAVKQESPAKRVVVDSQEAIDRLFE
ncbi:hypothetical protein JCM8547_001259 [Rhodosporidiobolus lusitaniae]